MSLLFENAIDVFVPKNATIFTLSESSILQQQRESRLPVETITNYAVNHNRLCHPKHEDWTCIPLHERDSAALTGDYLAYTDHDLRGELFMYRAEGTQQTMSADEFAWTALANRIRFWHSDHVPAADPDYYTSPIRTREPARNPIDAETPTDVFDGLEEFIESERAAQRQTNQASIADTPPQTIHETGGEAIPTVHSHGSPPHGDYRFHVPSNQDTEETAPDHETQSIQEMYGIYEGNEVLLYPPSEEQSPDAFPITATVTNLTGQTLFLAVDWDTIATTQPVARYLDHEREGYGITALLNPVPFDREKDAVTTLRDDTHAGELLTGQCDLTFSNSAAAQSTPLDTELNQEQQVAVKHALLADDLFCIHGPPGTGKTRTLIEIIRRAAQAGRSVLVCADSNQAVDNLVVGASTIESPENGSLHAYAQHGTDEFTLARNNAHRSTSPVVQRYYQEQKTVQADVVASTNSSAAGLVRDFDIAVIDEATQATCTATCIPLARADKLVLAGDHKQLPPFSATETPPDSTYGMSLFEHLYVNNGIYAGVGVQLRTQYRMHTDISDFPNRQFYDRTLRDGNPITALTDQPAIVGYDLGGTETTTDYSFSNPTEVRLVTYLTEKLLSADDQSIDPTDIGVITPYRAQVTAISDNLQDHLDTAQDIVVDTIDSFQGSEKTAILLSLVRSNADGDIGFMGRPTDGSRRLNVALTRAQRFCALIGDWTTLCKPTDTDKCTPLYTDLRAYLNDTGRLRRVDPELIPL
jgi:hypothetical protein